MLSRRNFLGAGVSGLAALALRTAHAGEKSGSRLFVYGVVDFGQGASRAIYEINPDSGTWRQVLDTGAPTARVSRDGRKIAVVNSGGQEEKDRGVWVADIEAGKKPERITELVGRPF